MFPEQSSQASRSTFDAIHEASPAPSAPVRPAPSSLASNSTIGKMSTHSMPVNSANRPFPSPGLAQAQRLDANRQLQKAILKKNKQMNMNKDPAFKRFGGAETAGSEADESHVANSEAPQLRSKVWHDEYHASHTRLTSLICRPELHKGQDTNM